jgi:hypothetical protein
MASRFTLRVASLSLIPIVLLGLALPPVLADAPKYNDANTPAAEITPPGHGLSETVMSRPRPDFDPVGYELGGFSVFPEAVVTIGYDDNIFRTKRNQTGDLVSVVRPRLQFRSDFGQHRLDVSAEAAAGLYAENNSENFFDYRGDVRGHVDLLRGLRLEAALTFEHGHEDRGSVENGGGAEPTEFDRTAALAVIAARSGRFRYRVGFGSSALDYKNVPAIGGGIVNNDDRDKVQLDVFARASMTVGANYWLFTSGTLTGSDFRSAVDDTGVNRDATGLSSVVGVEYDGGGLWFARGYVGHRQQVYDDVTLGDVAGVILGGQVTGNVTPLTTMTGSFDRDIVDTSVAGASSYWDSIATLRADHELLRNLIVSGAIRGRLNEFRGINRTDRIVGGGLSLRWLTSRSIWLTLDLDLDKRSSSGSARGGDFTQSRVFLRAVLQP